MATAQRTGTGAGFRRLRDTSAETGQEEPVKLTFQSWKEYFFPAVPSV